MMASLADTRGSPAGFRRRGDFVYNCRRTSGGAGKPSPGSQIATLKRFETGGAAAAYHNEVSSNLAFSLDVLPPSLCFFFAFFSPLTESF